MTQNSTLSRFAICIHNEDYPVALQLHKVYRLLPDEEATQDGDLRVVDESGEDYLYSEDYFLLLPLPKKVESLLSASFIGQSLAA